MKRIFSILFVLLLCSNLMKATQNRYGITNNINTYSLRIFQEVYNLADNSWYMLNSNNEYEKYGIIEDVPTKYKWQTLTSAIADDSHIKEDFNNFLAFRTIRITPDNVDKEGKIFLLDTQDSIGSHGLYELDSAYHILTGRNGNFELSRIFPGRDYHSRKNVYSVNSSPEFIKDGDSYLYTFDQNMYYTRVSNNDARVSTVDVLIPDFDNIPTYEGKIITMSDSLFLFQNGKWKTKGPNRKGWVNLTNDMDTTVLISKIRIDLSSSIGYGCCWQIFTDRNGHDFDISVWDKQFVLSFDILHSTRYSIRNQEKVSNTTDTYEIDFAKFNYPPLHRIWGDFNYAFFATQVYLEDYPVTYPIKETPQEVQNGTYVGLSGSGTESDPYLIGSAYELKLFRDLLGQNNLLHGRLTNDIVLNENVLDDEYNLNGDGSQFEQWTCEGHDVGSFNGAGHTISGLYINNSKEYQALFVGAVRIDSLGIIDSYIKANRHVAGICSWLRNGDGIAGRISDCYFDGVVIATSDKAGGIAAHMGNGYEGGLQNKIINCYSKGKVQGYNHVGGICGSAYSLTSSNEDYISNCYSIAQVSASWTDCGAICGYADNAYGSKVSADAYDCYTIASVASAKSGQGYNGETKSIEEFNDGTVLSLLNSNGGHFVQTIGEDDYPVLFKKNDENQKIVHEYVDLGLPSGTLWATCNIGASSPEDYGDYFAWGEVVPKNDYSWNTYKFGTNGNFSKYNSSDKLTELESEDDAAHIIWGDGWRMPTHDDEKELVNNCTWQSTTINGISGYKITGPNGNYIFMPRGGLYDGTDFECNGTIISSLNSCGWYWSSTLNNIGSMYAQGLYLSGSPVLNVADHERCDGHNIRPVKRINKIIKQPTLEDLSVEVTSPESASYQWYRSVLASSSFENWTSTNAGVSSSNSNHTYNIIGTAGQTISFDWNVSSEAGYDYLQITKNGITIINESGEKSGTYSYTLQDRETITIVATYSKDGSVNSNSDQATITNFVVNGIYGFEPITNSTESSLSDELIERSGEYYCEIRYSNCSDVLISDTVSLEVMLITDGTVYDNDEDSNPSKIVYTRTFSSADKWQALYVPFSIPVDVLTENGLEVVELNNIHMYDTDGDKQFDKTTLEFLYLTDGETEANYPYLIKSANAGEVKLMLKDVELKAAAETQIECASTRKVFKIKGTYTGVSGADMFYNNYYAVGGGTLVRAASADNALKPQRWYMSIENKDGSPVDYFAPKMRIMVNGMEIEEYEENETGIQEISAKHKTEKTIYTLDGRRLVGTNALKSGIYVKNHQKMIVR